MLDTYIDKEKLKNLMREILAIEQEKGYITADIKQIKSEMVPYFPNKGVAKAIKIYNSKGYDTCDILDYKEIATLLGIPFACEVFQPIQENLPEGLLENRKNVLSLLQRYNELDQERKDLMEQIRGCYTKAKAMGISVPMLKKAIDFCLHPDKLNSFYEESPLLESYVSASEDLR